MSTAASNAIKVNKHCAVQESGRGYCRNKILECDVHSIAMKKAVPGRSKQVLVGLDGLANAGGVTNNTTSSSRRQQTPVHPRQSDSDVEITAVSAARSGMRGTSAASTTYMSPTPAFRTQSSPQQEVKPIVQPDIAKNIQK